MRKKLQVMAVIISGTFISAALAADKTVPTYGGVTAPDPSSSGQIMSNDSFNGTVEKRAAETTNKLSQTVQQQLKSSTPPPPPSTSTAPASSQEKAAQPAQGSDADAANMPPKTQPATPPQAMQPVTPAPAQSSTSQPATSTDVYTGFGSGQSNQGNQKSNSNSSSGGSQDGKSKNWNVGY